MHILCPHCCNPIEVVKIVASEEVTCPSCGSSFHLNTDATTGLQRQAGQKLGRFELIEIVGQGAFGTVYKARDPELDRLVALKVPRAGNLTGSQELDRFLREARSAAQLRHPSIVSVHEVAQFDGLPCLVSDFVRGVTLADILSARRPGFRETAELVAAVADALHHAHDHGVVHRDVKPSNIIIGEDGRPCVMDFGLAKREAAEVTMTLEGQVLGTPAYMSPEQARGEGHGVDGRGDIYSLGVVLYQMLTGELPFRGTQRMLLHQVLYDEPRPPRSLNDCIPRNLETITLKAMAKDPKRRYSSAKEFADDLRRFLQREPILARPVGKVERLWRWCRRNPAKAGLTTALLVVVLIAQTVLTVLYSRAEEQRRAAEQQKQFAERHLRLLANVLSPIEDEKAHWDTRFRNYVYKQSDKENGAVLRQRIDDTEQAIHDLPPDMVSRLLLRRFLALHYLKFGTQIAGKMDMTLSLPWCDKAIQLLLEEAKQPIDFQIVVRMNLLDQAYVARARILFDLERYSEAAADYKKALTSDPKKPETWLEYTYSLRFLRQYDRLIDEAKAMASANLPGNFAYKASCLCIGVRADLPPDSPKAEEFAQLAVRLLHRAITQRHVSVADIKKDDLWRSFFSRPEFQAILKGSEAKGIPQS